MKIKETITWFKALGHCILLGVGFCLLVWLVSLAIFPALDEIRDSGIQRRQMEATSFHVCSKCVNCE